MFDLFSFLNSVPNTYIRRPFKSNSPGMEEDTQKKNIKIGSLHPLLVFRVGTWKIDGPTTVPILPQSS